MSKDDDQSMEEILQSIKRIIADEEDPEAPPPKETKEEAPAEEPAAEPVAEEAPKEEAPKEEPKEEEPLELTEVVEEGSVPEDIVVAEDKAEPEPAAPKDAVEELLSEDTAQAASAALKNLPSKPAAPATDGLAFRGGTTVEDLVVEAMRPILKDWLDANLPTLVERLVEKEIKKLSD